MQEAFDNIMVTQEQNDIKQDIVKNCKHYKRNCKIISPCCQLPYYCRLCHDNCFQLGKGCQIQQMERKEVSQILCKNCEEIQPTSNQCIKCNIQFGSYFCLECKLWDSTLEKQIFHCQYCGICRLGNKDTTSHCFKCGFCYNKDALDTHQCKEGLDQEDCCICFQPFHNSRNGIAPFGKCGHFLHYNCLQKYLRTNINCPICSQSYCKETDEQIQHIDQLVENSREQFLNAPEIDIWCHNCRKESQQVKYNYYGMKCQNCGSYNTKFI